MMTLHHCVTLVAALFFCLAPAAAAAGQRVDLRLDAEQAEAVLAIVVRNSRGEQVTPADWDRLVRSPAYVRLKEREQGMGRTFRDQDFREFVLSPELAGRAARLQTALRDLQGADLGAAAARVLPYLPAEARIAATVYVLIMPRGSFVYQLATDPAIFLALDSDQTRAQFENVVAHELHHVGFASIPRPSYDGLPPAVAAGLGWMGALGEGYAMLAAAGGRHVHPHAASPPEDRQRWDRDLAGFSADLRTLEAFFLDVLHGRLGEEEARRAGFSFFGVQGPWYTVGWKVAVVVEEHHGRAALVEAMADPRRMLTLYNRAAQEANRSGAGLPLWSPELLQAAGAR
jgi:hypothetical protein